MKLVSRLALIAIIVVIAFVSISLLGVRLLNETRSIANLATRLDRLSAETWHLQSLTLQTLHRNELSRSIPEWVDTAEFVHNGLREFPLLPMVGDLADRNPEFGEIVVAFGQVTELVGQQLTSFGEILSELTEEFTTYPADALDNLNRRGYGYEAVRAISTGTNVVAYLDTSLQALITRATDRLAQIREQTARAVMIAFFSVVGAATVIVALLILLFLRSLRRRFAGIGSSMHKLAEGDLTVELDHRRNDEVSQLAGQIQEHIDEFARVVGNITSIVNSAQSLRTELMAASEESAASVTQIGGNINSIITTVKDLDDTIEQTGAALGEIAESTRELESLIEQQAHSVEESSSAVEQMTASVTSVSRIAADRQEAAVKLKTVTGKGHANIEATNQKVAAIAESVDEALGIITVINKIASQTSILSMNAAIEAAHAGQYGHGFSVVAEEIQRLSESTNANAKKIKEQLNAVATLAKDTREASATTRSTFSSVEEEAESTAAALREISATMQELAGGTETVLNATAQTGQITRTIREDATAVAVRSGAITGDMDHIREISTAVRGGTQEIGVGTTEMNQMVSNLSTVTRELTDQIDLLGASVSHFSVREGEPAPLAVS